MTFPTLSAHQIFESIRAQDVFIESGARDILSESETRNYPGSEESDSLELSSSGERIYTKIDGLRVYKLIPTRGEMIVDEYYDITLTKLKSSLYLFHGIEALREEFNLDGVLIYKSDRTCNLYPYDYRQIECLRY